MTTKRRKIFLLIGGAWLAALGAGAAPAGLAATPFFDDFNGTQLDTNRWKVMDKAWGNNNGGVVPDNVVVSNGMLHLIGHGDEYTGPVHGVNRKGQRVARTTRVGAVVVTTNYFASGRFEVRLKLPAQPGACSAIWTYHYEEAYPNNLLHSQLAQVGGLTVSNLLWMGLTADEAGKLLADATGNLGARPPYLKEPTNGVYQTTAAFRRLSDVRQMKLVDDFGKRQAIFVALQNAVSLKNQGNADDGYYLIRNEEIDIETPTALKTGPSDISYRHARFNNWVGIDTGEYTDKFDDLGKSFNDGQFHVYRFDWHTDNSKPLSQRVEYYIDNVCYQTNYTQVPIIGGQFTVGLWYPTWAGTPNYDTQELDVDWVRITPFNENGDEWVKETD